MMRRGREDREPGHVHQPHMGIELGEQISAEHIDHHLEYAEHAGLYDRDGMQQGTDRRGGNHGRRQPLVEGHDRGLTDTKNEEREER